MRTRRDANENGGGWTEALEWYAKAVAVMMERPFSDRTSWWFLGAIHGFDEDGWRRRGLIGPDEPVPAEGPGRLFDQCQHQGWYFLPWHRGYLAAFENIVGKAIADLGGPEDWALPYWNYLGSGTEARRIPAALTSVTLPDGTTPNPLARPVRTGSEVLGPQGGVRDIRLDAQTDETRFTGTTGVVAYGGAATGEFVHFGAQSQTGALEGNPHNTVHVMIGGFGRDASEDLAGWMIDPNYAALDPVFWLHHCNIDRLWEAWMNDGSHQMENGASWRSGPADRNFEMPKLDGTFATFSPGDTMPGGPLAPRYDDLYDGTGIKPVVIASAEETSGVGAMPASLVDREPPAAVLLGASDESLRVGTERAATIIGIESPTAPAGDPREQRIFVNLENVTGGLASAVLDVYVDINREGDAASSTEPVDQVVLFGLAKASQQDGAHGGNGLSASVDVTAMVRERSNELGVPAEKLSVRVQQPTEGAKPVSIDRISVYRQPVE